jgi:hypothetical protein
MSKGKYDKYPEYWIKYNLQRDGTPIWVGVTGGEVAIKNKMAELIEWGYKPFVDHDVTKQCNESGIHLTK